MKCYPSGENYHHPYSGTVREMSLSVYHSLHVHHYCQHISRVVPVAASLYSDPTNNAEHHRTSRTVQNNVQRHRIAPTCSELLQYSIIAGVLHLQGQIKSKIFDAQQELEKLQRKEEDELMEKFWVDCSEDKKVGPVSHCFNEAL